MWCLVIFVQRPRCCTCIWIMDSWPDGMCCYMSFIIASHETVRGILQWRTDTLCPTPVTLLHRYRDSTAVPGAEDNAAPKFAAHIRSQPASLLSMIQLACTPPPLPAWQHWVINTGFYCSDLHQARLMRRALPVYRYHCSYYASTFF